MADDAAEAPTHLEGPLFEAVHREGIFADSKRFADAVPLVSPGTIVTRYEERRHRPGFDLRAFIERHFEVPSEIELSTPTNGTIPLERHIDEQWVTLRRAQQARNEFDTLIPLPHPHVVPGGRFREMYYWDSYFVAEGLAAAGHYEGIREMAENLAHLIDRFGYVPNGNQRYYLGRSQPPVFCRMIELLAERDGTEAVSRFLPSLESEYRFWMDGAEPGIRADEPGRRLVPFRGTHMNRYWGGPAMPRRESFREDLDVGRSVDPSRRPALYRDIRAACESGWDFSSRWLADSQEFRSIRTTRVLPVDLNACLCYLEYRLADWLDGVDGRIPSSEYRRTARTRHRAIREHFWDADEGYFFDIDLGTSSTSERWTLAGVVPLHFGLASERQADRTAETLESTFMRPGGLVATTVRSGQQWDAPNGWAPLHWFAVTGLRRYGHDDLADAVKGRWLDTVQNAYDRTGKLFEKYDVEDPSRQAGGGEYPSQSGFAWTNAIVLALGAEPRTGRVDLGGDRGPIDDGMGSD